MRHHHPPGPSDTLPPPAWLAGALGRLAELVRDRLLPPDGQAAPVARTVLMALELGSDDIEGDERPMGGAVPMPFIRATFSCGVQVEWKAGRDSVLLDIGRDGSVEWRARSNGVAWEIRPRRKFDGEAGWGVVADGRRLVGWVLGRDGGLGA